MKIVSSLLLVVILLEFTSFLTVEAKLATATATASAVAYVDPCCHVVCPNSFLPVPATSTFTKTDAVALIKNQWNQTTPELSCEGKRLKKIILKMFDSHHPRLKEVAYITSMSFWSTVDMLSDNIEFCTLSQMINTSVAWENKHCCKSLSKAVDDMSLTTFSDRINLMLAATFKSAGCEQPPVLPAKVSCYGNGTVYKIKEFWKHNRKDYPCKFAKTILKLHKSQNPVDQYLALVATVCSSKIVRKLMGTYEPSLTMKLFDFQDLPKIHKCCCPKLKAELNALQDMNKSYIQKIKDDTKRAFNC